MSDGLDSLTLDEAVQKHKDHRSIHLILNRVSLTDEFSFNFITPDVFSKYVSKLQNSKAVGHDSLKASFLKLSGSRLCDLFNTCVTASFFPTDMKLMKISPIFKKNDNLCKENYRSINLLTSTSKVLKNIMSDQITEYFSDPLSSSLSAYRKGYSCQHVILRLTEYWRQALDDNGNTVGTIVMDLSRAFDNMPHALLIAKLQAYGVSIDACNLIISYLRNLNHRVKIMGRHSDWATINRRVPPGSVLGPLLFNIFINDLFYINMKSDIANNADDNHLYYENKCHDELKKSVGKWCQLSHCVVCQ